MVLYLSFKILKGLAVRALFSPSSWRVNGRTERTGAQWFVCFYVVHITACCPERLFNWGYKTHFFLLYLYLMCSPFLWSFPSSISHQSATISFLPSIQCLSLLVHSGSGEHSEYGCLYNSCGFPALRTISPLSHVCNGAPGSPSLYLDENNLHK